MRWGWVRRMPAAVFPWQPRSERKAQIQEARGKAAEAEVKVQEAYTIVRDLNRILRENHFAEAIVEGLMEGRRQQHRHRGDR